MTNHPQETLEFEPTTIHSGRDPAQNPVDEQNDYHVAAWEWWPDGIL